MGSYIPTNTAETAELLDVCGLAATDELFSLVPDEVALTELNLPKGVSEFEAFSCLEGMAEQNLRFKQIFRGAGAYRHYIPAIVKTVTSKEEFLTAYTPYQAEISQGVLQSIFEYQSQMCELTGLDVSNASVYDGASAAAEACLMCLDRKHTRVLVSGTTHPQVIETIKTYCENRNVPCYVVPSTQALTSDLDALKAACSDDVAALYVQSPNYFGVIEDVASLVELGHGVGAKVVQGFNPISLGMLKTPGEYGADIAVGEGQPLGMPLAFGGPYLGIMCATQDMMRKLPGRIVGETVDAEGKRAFVLTLQAREQHIRREKASSNICSNEALCAMTASVYLAALGPYGLRSVAESSCAHAHYLARGLADLGLSLVSDATFFNEFVTQAPAKTDELLDALAKEGILGGLPLEEGILWCCTELNTREACDRVLAIAKEVL